MPKDAQRSSLTNFLFPQIANSLPSLLPRPARGSLAPQSRFDSRLANPNRPAPPLRAPLRVPPPHRVDARLISSALPSSSHRHGIALRAVPFHSPLATIQNSFPKGQFLAVSSPLRQLQACSFCPPQAPTQTESPQNTILAQSLRTCSSNLRPAEPTFAAKFQSSRARANLRDSPTSIHHLPEPSPNRLPSGTKSTPAPAHSSATSESRRPVRAPSPAATTCHPQHESPPRSGVAPRVARSPSLSLFAAHDRTPHPHGRSGTRYHQSTSAAHLVEYPSLPLSCSKLQPASALVPARAPQTSPALQSHPRVSTLSPAPPSLRLHWYKTNPPNRVALFSCPRRASARPFPAARPAAASPANSLHSTDRPLAKSRRKPAPTRIRRRPLFRSTLL